MSSPSGPVGRVEERYGTGGLAVAALTISAALTVLAGVIYCCPDDIYVFFAQLLGMFVILFVGISIQISNIRGFPDDE
jgi:hypothetical protein